ncbi:hypothetical protein [Helcococcus sueciensis]|uniref:hypothetical protein n=1 Tax=Helcococcus sueciensis TaxID=241555 RepID=UPI0004272EC5|nr:hypothetical protein [Helcococcus sueciensis]
MRQKNKLIYIIAILVLFIIAFLLFTSRKNTNIKEIKESYKETHESDNYYEKIKPDIIKLLNMPESEQDSKEDNELRAKLTGFSIKEIEDFRSEEKAFNISNPEIYNIVFSDIRREYLIKQFELEDLFN